MNFKKRVVIEWLKDKLPYINFYFDIAYVVLLTTTSFIDCMRPDGFRKWLFISILIISGIFIYIRKNTYKDKKRMFFSWRLFFSIVFIFARMYLIIGRWEYLDDERTVYIISIFYFTVVFICINFIDYIKDLQRFAYFLIIAFLLRSLDLTNLSLFFAVISIIISNLNEKHFKKLYKNRGNRFDKIKFFKDKVEILIYIVLFYITMLIADSNKNLTKSLLVGIQLNDGTLYDALHKFFVFFSDPFYKMLVFIIVYFFFKPIIKRIKRSIYMNRYRYYKLKHVYIKGKIKPIVKNTKYLSKRKSLIVRKGEA